MSEFTDEEWALVMKYFPRAVRTECKKTDESTSAYNATAWVLGLTDWWIDAPDDEQEFKAFCEASIDH